MQTIKRSTGSLRYVITGGMGFIGSHLAEALLDRGHKVTIIDNLSTGRFENIEHLIDRPGFQFAVDNIISEVVLDRLVSECDIIFHLAAAVGVKLVVENPVHTIETNVMGTEAILKAALRYRAKVLIASTSEVYGKGIRIPFAESDDCVLGPTSHSRWGYAASKMTDEFLGLAYHRQKDLPVVIFRLFNTVGPRQTGYYGMVIPRLVEQALRGEPLTVFGDGQQSRCFLHVHDAVEALIALSTREDAVGQVFNLGTTEEITIVDLARRVLQVADKHRASQPHALALGNGAAIMPDEDRIVFIPYAQAYAKGFEDMRRRVPDISKIYHYIGWQPRRTLNDILHDVVTSMAAEKVEALA
ncbi:MAG TPA: GDP-mannose 4,6-dehydratase [Roseiflexaceae bacterium]|nr:GDP-mannose 4,6-dehydratase [Roseiflexaceae bacterium]